MPDQEEQGLDRSARPSLDEVLDVRERQASEIEVWLAEVTAEQLSQTAPVPDRTVAPVRQGAVGAAVRRHRPQRGVGPPRLLVRDLDKLSGQEAPSAQR